MRLSWILLAVLSTACSGEDETAPSVASASRTARDPAAGEWAGRAEALVASLAGGDLRTPEAQFECMEARSLAAMAKARAEAKSAEVSAAVEQHCMQADVWTSLRGVSELEGTTQGVACDYDRKIVAASKKAGADVSALEAELEKACKGASASRAALERLDELEKLALDSEEAIAICRNAVAMTVGTEHEAKVAQGCRVSALYGELANAGEYECIAASVHLGEIERAKDLRGKVAKAAKQAFARTCGKTAKGDPIGDLKKLRKLDPASETARHLCRRAAAFAGAQVTQAAREALEARRKAACAKVEG